jgi:hypothetical protein
MAGKKTLATVVVTVLADSESFEDPVSSKAIGMPDRFEVSSPDSWRLVWWPVILEVPECLLFHLAAAEKQTLLAPWCGRASLVPS